MELQDRRDESFAQGLAYGFTPSMAAENAGLEMTQVEAKHYSVSPHVAARVVELMTTQFFDSSNEHIRIAHQLEIDRDFAYRMGNPAAAINATVQRAKVLGLYVEKVDTNTNLAVSSPEQLTTDEWQRRFGAKAIDGPKNTSGLPPEYQEEYAMPDEKDRPGQGKDDRDDKSPSHGGDDQKPGSDKPGPGQGQGQQDRDRPSDR